MAKKLKISSPDTYVHPELKKLKKNKLTHNKELSKRKENNIISASKEPLCEVIVTEEKKSSRELRSTNLVDYNSIKNGVFFKLNSLVKNELKKNKDDSSIQKCNDVKNNGKKLKKAKNIFNKKEYNLNNDEDYTHVVLRKNIKTRKALSPKRVSCKTNAQKNKIQKELSKFRCSPYTTSVELEEILHGMMSDLKKVVSKRKNRSKLSNQYHDDMVYHSLLEKRLKTPIKKRKIVRKLTPDFKILHEGKISKSPESRCSSIRVELASSVNQSKIYYNEFQQDRKKLYSENAVLTKIENLPIGESQELASCTLTTRATPISPKLTRIGRSPKHGNIAMNIAKDQPLNECAKSQVQTKKNCKDNISSKTEVQYPTSNEINMDESVLHEIYDKEVKNVLLSNKAVNTKNHRNAKSIDQDTLKIKKKKKKKSMLKRHSLKSGGLERGTMTNIENDSKKSNLKNTLTNTSPMQRSESEISIRLDPTRKHGYSKDHSCCNIDDPLFGRSKKHNGKASSKQVDTARFGRKHRTHRVFPSEHFGDRGTAVETSSLEGNNDSLSYCDRAVGTTWERCKVGPLRSMIEADPTLNLCSKQVKKVCQDKYLRKLKSKRMPKNNKDEKCQHSEGNTCDIENCSCSGDDFEADGYVSYMTMSSSDNNQI